MRLWNIFFFVRLLAVLVLCALAPMEAPAQQGVTGFGKGVTCNGNAPVGTAGAAVLGTTAGADTGSPTCTGVTCFVKVTALDFAGGESLPHAEQSQAVAGGNRLTVQVPAAGLSSSIASYNVYVSTTTGTEKLQTAGAPIAPGGTWTESTSAGLQTVTAPPGADTTGKPTEVLPSNGSRASFTMTNDSNTGTIRFGFIAKSAGSPVLDDTNSAVLLVGGSYSNSEPVGYDGRILCQSSTSGGIVIHNTEISTQ